MLIILFSYRQQILAQIADQWPVKFVRIEGTFQFLQKNKVKEAIEKQIDKGLYRIDLVELEKRMEMMQWVENAAIKRIWPDTLRIQITEQHPVARWYENSLLSDKGQLFQPENISEFSQLPVIEGNEGGEVTLVEHLTVINQALTRYQFQVEGIKVNERQAWTLKLDNAMQIKLGRHAPMDKFYRFMGAVQLLGYEQLQNMAVADLRYPNGFAIQWKDLDSYQAWKMEKHKNKTH